MGKSLFDFLGPALGGLAGVALAPFTAGTSLALSPLLGGAIGSGIGSGITTGVKTGNPLAGLGAGVLGGVGSYAGGSLLGPELGSIGSSTNAISGGTTPGFLGQTLGDFAGNSIPEGLSSATLGGLAGSSVGSSVGSQIGGQTGLDLTGGPSGVTTNTAFDASKSGQPAMGLPQSLSQLSGLDQNQQATNIASKGVYGGGQGQDETNYFLNLMNRQLFDQGGNVAQNTNGIAPVDMSFLNQLGISGSSPTDLLKGISQYGHA